MILKTGVVSKNGSDCIDFVVFSPDVSDLEAEHYFPQAQDNALWYCHPALVRRTKRKVLVIQFHGYKGSDSND